MSEISKSRQSHNSASSLAADRPIVFYDGQCPLCSREIAHYRKLSGAQKLLWVDISSSTQSLDSYDLDREAAMARFHVLDRNGQWQTGAWGFAELWSHLPAYRWLSIVLRRLGLIPVLDYFYSRFAKWRLRRSCNDKVCSVEGHDQ